MVCNVCVGLFPVLLILNGLSQMMSGLFGIMNIHLVVSKMVLQISLFSRESINIHSNVINIHSLKLRVNKLHEGYGGFRISRSCTNHCNFFK